MKPYNNKGRCTKVNLKKSSGVVRTYDDVQLAYVQQLDNDPQVQSIQCNVRLDGTDGQAGQWTSDIICQKTDGEYMVRECVFTTDGSITPRVCKLLDISRKYWLRRGVNDWGIAIGGRKNVC